MIVKNTFHSSKSTWFWQESIIYIMNIETLSVNMNINTMVKKSLLTKFE